MKSETTLNHVIISEHCTTAFRIIAYCAVLYHDADGKVHEVYKEEAEFDEPTFAEAIRDARLWLLEQKLTVGKSGYNLLSPSDAEAIGYRDFHNLSAGLALLEIDAAQYLAGDYEYNLIDEDDDAEEFHDTLSNLCRHFNEGGFSTMIAPLNKN